MKWNDKKSVRMDRVFRSGLIILCIGFRIANAFQPSPGAIPPTVSSDNFKFTADEYDVSIHENTIGKVFARPVVIRMGIRVLDPALGIRYRIVEGDRTNFFKAESLTVGDFCFLLIRTRTNAPGVLNREMKRGFYLTVRAIGKYPLGETFTADTSVKVKVVDRNDLAPLFYPMSYRFEIGEDTALFSTIGRVIASDADEGINGDLYYRFVQKTRTFAVHPTSGVITLTRRLVYSEQNTYEFDVLATDRGPKYRSSFSARRSMGRVVIRVVQKNLHAPRIDVKNLPIVNDEVSVGTIYAVLTVSDRDTGQNGQIGQVNIVNGDPDERFKLVQKTKADAATTTAEYNIEISKPLKRDVIPAYNLTIQAIDRGMPPRMSVVIVTVKIRDSRQIIAEFTTEYTLDVVENTPVYSPLLFVRADDRDSNLKTRFIEYAIERSNELDKWFKVNSRTGLISVARPLDYEEASRVILIVTARDVRNLNSPPVTRTKVTFNIVDFNDNSPVFSDDSSDRTVWIEENQPIGTLVYQVSASDADTADNGYVTYSIPDSDSAPFEIDYFSGKITTKKVLDFETMRRRYKLRIRASDWGTPFRRESEISLTIGVKDLNENKPKFEKVDCKGFVSREADVGTELVVLSALDFDSGNIISYRMLSGNDDSCFSLVSSTGVLSLSRDLREIDKNFFSLKITASDGTNLADPVTVNTTVVAGNNRNNQLNGGNTNEASTFTCRDSGVLSELGELIRQSQAANDDLETDDETMNYEHSQNYNSPKFDSNLPPVVSVDENKPVASTIIKMAATDADEGFNGKLQFVISGGNNDSCFTIDTDSGEVKILSPLDRETTDYYALSISVSDLGRPSLTSVRSLGVKINDVNDRPPVFTMNAYEAEISESAAPGFTVVRVTAEDSDLGENARVSYTLVSDEPAFSVESETGIIRVNDVLDREKQSVYELHVRAVDHAPSNPLSSTATVVVRLTDVNDNPPRCQPEQTIVKAREDLPIGAVVSVLRAQDPDLEDGGLITFKFQTGHRDKFEIDRKTGVVRVADELDYESDQRFNITVRVRDKGRPSLASWCRLIVEVVDVDENLQTPMFSRFVLRGSVKENLPIGSSVMSLKAKDDDRALIDRTISYSIEGGTGLGRFTIDESGVVKTAVVLDRESTPFYWITVYATDHGAVPRSSYAEVYIEIIDVNDNIPQAEEPVYYPSVYENSKPGTTVIQIQGYDLDDNQKQKLTYRITGGDPQSLFQINQYTGIITTTKRRLDRERQEEHILEITLNDGGTPELTSTTRVVVQVGDINDHAPKFNEPMYRVRIPAASRDELNEPFFRAIACDADIGPNGDITYSLKGGKKRFSIDPKTGEVSAIRDLEQGESFEIIVKANDNGRPQKKSTVRLLINVLQRVKTSLSPPIFELHEREVTVLENDPIGHMVVLVIASDPDHDKLWYKITVGNEEKKFSINPESGNVIVAERLDWETTNSYNLTISVTDGVFTVFTWVSVIIGDINDNRPEFLLKNYTTEIAENTRDGTRILAVTAIDKDKDNRLFYTIHTATNLASLSLFSIDSRTGVLSTKGLLDHEAISRHELVIMVRDQGVPSKRSLQRVIINVIDHNDHAPEFLSSSFEGQVFETAALGTSICRVLVADRDKGDNAKVQLRLISGNVGGMFVIDQDLGIITLAKTLDRSVQTRYNLIVLATDHGTPSLSSSVDVQINVTISDNAPPKFERKEYTTELLENQPVGKYVLVVKATSKSSIVYEITHDAGTCRDYFNLNQNSGILSTKTVIDYERTKYCNISVTATNMVGATARVNVGIHVIDVNDNKPEFLRRNYTGTVIEGRESAGILDETGAPLVVRARDNDTNQNALLSYFIVDARSRVYFTIDANTGALRLRTRLDRERVARHVFRVQVRDHGSPRLRAGEPANVVIDVLDVNDSPPRFSTDLYSTQMILPTYEDVVVATVYATDADTDRYSIIGYSIIDGNHDHVFEIDRASGVVRVKNPDSVTDREIIIEATDGLHKSSVALDVEVRQSRASGLKFTRDIYEGVVTENSSDVATVAVVQLVGSKLNEYLRFSILNPSDLFTIGKTSGVVQKTNAVFDREKKDSYRIIVEVSDDKPSARIAHVIVNVMVTDVNDNAPMFVNQPYYAVVHVESKVGEVIKQVTAIDADIGLNAEVLYKLDLSAARALKDKIAINDFTGELHLTAPLEQSDENAEYTITVIAEDKGFPRRQSKATVPLRVINRGTPLFDEQFYTATLRENSPLHSAIIQIEAKSPNNKKLIYSISKGDIYNEFNVDFDTDMTKFGPCALTVADRLDYELKNSYELMLRATDTLTGAYAEVPVLVKLEDVNDNIPSFLSQHYSTTVSEAVAIGTSILTVSAQDHDSGQNAVIHYKLRESLVTNHHEYFTIDARTGVIRTKLLLDREEFDQMRFEVEAADRSLSSTVHVNVIITDLNDNAPQFDNPSYECAISDDAKRGQFVTMVTASDADSNDNGNLRFSIVDGNEQQTFFIDEKLGIVSLSQLRIPDLDAAYLLNVSVTDGVFTNFATIRIMVQSSNHYAPVFTETVYKMAVNESLAEGSRIMTVSAVDRDTGRYGIVAYSIVSDELKQFFRIDSRSGIIYLHKRLDYEVKTSFDIPIMAIDVGGRSGFTTLMLKVLDVNDNSPKFLLSQYRANVRGTAHPDTMVAHIRATDADSGDNAVLEYSIHDENSTVVSTLFSVEDFTGIIRVQSYLNQSEGKTFHFFIRVSDKGSPKLENVVPVEIYVIPRNISPPFFEQSSYIYFIPENTAVGSVVTTIRSISSNATVTYSIVAGSNAMTNKPPRFDINQRGKVSLIEPIDYEDVQKYTLTLKVTQNTLPPLVDYTLLTIEVMDLNDNTPEFESNPYKASLVENSIVGKQVVQVRAHDLDSGDNSRITYQFVESSSNVANVFAIDPETGWIVTLVEVDRERMEKFEFQVRAVDAGSSRRTGLTTVRIDVMDLNDEPPVFRVQKYRGAVNEDALPGTVIVTVATTDRDLGQNAKVSYYISRGDALGQFDVRQTGEIYVRKILDRERKASYDLTIVASDGSFITTTQVIISILDANDNDPVCSQSMYQVIKPEDIPVGSFIASVQASDRDEPGTRHSRIRYSVTGKQNDHFNMHTHTGILTTMTALDRETISEYHLIVKAADGGGRFCTADIFISLSDVNDNAPRFLKNQYTVAVAENSQVNTLLTRVSAEDADIGINRKVKYSITGKDSQHFAIDSQSGIVSVLRQLDREQQPKYNLTLLAYDQGTPRRTGSTTLAVVLLDVNDNPPMFELSTYVETVSEGTAPGLNILTVHATSKDLGENADISYSIAGGNEQMKFAVDAKTGEISVIGDLDYEVNKEYFLTIEATDKGSPPLTNSARININISDINDNSPIFTQKIYEINVKENVNIGERIIQVEASDADSPLYSKVTYRLKNKTVPFLIDSDTGYISLSATLNREQIDSYKMTVIAEDSGKPALMTEATVSITVLDVNDNPPVFHMENYTAIVQVNDAGESRRPIFFERSDVGTSVAKLILTDDDLPPNGEPFSYEIIRGNTDNKFHITRTGVLTTTARFERKLTAKYLLVIRAFDSGTPPLYADATLVVRIIEESSFPPSVKPLNLSVNAYLGKFAGGRIGRVEARDPDKYDKLVYGLISEEKRDLFSIDEIEGVISADKGLDAGNYSLNVSVSDGKFTVYTHVRVGVNAISESMVDNAVSVRLGDVSPDEFLSKYSRKFKQSLTAILGVSEVYIISIQPLSKQTRHRRKRVVDDDIEILVAAKKSNDNFVKKNTLKRRISQNLDEIEKSVGIKVKKVTSTACKEDSCIEGKCLSLIEFNDEDVFTIITKNDTFSSPRYKVTQTCECKEHFGGEKCDIALNDCSKNPCNSYKTCVADKEHGYFCICPEGKTGEKCDGNDSKENCVEPECIKKPEPTAMTFSGTSYSLWELSQAVDTQLRIDFFIRTIQKNAVIMYVNNHMDWMTLEMYDGAVQYRSTRFNMFGAMGVARVNQLVNDGQWHRITLESTENMVKLIIDEKFTSQAAAPADGAFIVKLDDFELFFGAEVESLSYPYSEVKKGFDGCMKDMFVNGIHLPIHDVHDAARLTKMENINFGCDDKIFDIAGVCRSQPCRNGGTCMPQSPNSFLCMCTVRYQGTKCEVDAMPCTSNPCLNGGICENRMNDYICKCTVPFTGKNCDYGFFCKPNPCRNNGICIEGQTGPLCRCKGHKGMYCEDDIDECRDHPCLNGGTCINLAGSFRCNCTRETSGNLCQDRTQASFISFDSNKEEIIGISVVIAAILIIVIIIVVVVRRYRKKNRDRLINNSCGGRGNLLNMKTKEELKRAEKLSNLDAATTVNNPAMHNIPPSPHMPQIPARPLSYAPGGANEPMNPLNNFDMIRNYGSAADELENINSAIYTPEFLQNLQKNSNVAPSQHHGYHGDDTSSIRKPSWDNEYQNIVDNLDNLKPLKDNTNKPINKPQPDNGSTISLPMSENEDDLPANAKGKQKGYHWDTSDWAPKNVLSNISELPVKEVRDDSRSSGRNSNESNLPRDLAKNHLHHDDDDEDDIQTDDNLDSEYVGDSEYPDDLESDAEVFARDSPQLNEPLLNQNGLTYDDLPRRDYNVHPNQYLPSYSYSIPSMIDEPGLRVVDIDAARYDARNARNPNEIMTDTDGEILDDGDSIADDVSYAGNFTSANVSMSDVSVSGLCAIEDSEFPMTSDNDSDDDENRAAATHLIGSHLHSQV
ncbi:protocadherin Fat 1-like [Tubulanus polymorphus]|uniref:protocadherin Fat 1-like n=1 Tax=Tubulanus polymorphus TaxID=672921 RepID=UPI003DA3DFA4